MARGKVALVVFALVVSTVWVYYPAFDFGYVSYDDPEYVADNAVVQRGLTLDGLRSAFREPHHSNWHPLTTLSYMLDCELFGTDHGAQHTENVLFHLLNALLLFSLMLRTTGALWRSAAVAALFALHPLHVESVAWIAERKDVLSVFFTLATTHAYISFTASPRASRYAFVLLLFAAALMAKPMVVTWPLALLLFDFWPLDRLGGVFRGERGSRQAASQSGRIDVSLQRAVLEKVPLFALSVLSSALTLWAQQQGGGLRTNELRPMVDRLANVPIAYVAYLRKAMWPADLAVLYPFPESLPPWQVLGSAALLAAISIGCIRARRGRPYLLFGWAFYLGALVPVIGVVPVGAQAYADRYTYLPLVGIYCAVVWALGDAVFGRPTVRTPVVVLASCVLCLLAVRAFYQVGVWESSTKLYRHGLQVTDPNPILRNNLGIALTDGGNYEEAVQVYEHGLRAPSKFHHILNYNLGMAHANLGRHAEAVRAFDRALRIDREYEEALYHKGRSLKTLGDLEGAQLALEHATQLAPGEPDVLYELGLVLGRLGRTAEARNRFSQVLVLRPGHVDARINLAVAHLKTGDAQSAIEQLNRVLQADPQHDAAHHYLELAKARLPAEDRN